ncbi:MAG: hypothetical protein FJ147_09825 [Deltaproteobacteria bacterium]|nr:hypothetical protein [Deltaproteobacteria bacterium]
MSQSTSPQSVFDLFYRMDSAGVLIEVGGKWDQFAQENGGAALIGQAVIGKPMLRFITGDAPRMHFLTLLEKHRLLAGESILPYRCDSPQHKRFMEMRMRQDHDGTILCLHRTVRVEPLSPARSFVYHKASTTASRCSMCNRVRVDKFWVEPEATPASETHPLGVVYTVCADCRAGIKRKAQT